ncbi:hypothetical protein BLA29_005574, partial [Euroglyphus maynei]
QQQQTSLQDISNTDVDDFHPPEELEKIRTEQIIFAIQDDDIKPIGYLDNSLFQVFSVLSRAFLSPNKIEMMVQLTRLVENKATLKQVMQPLFDLIYLGIMGVRYRNIDELLQSFKDEIELHFWYFGSRSLSTADMKQFNEILALVSNNDKCKDNDNSAVSSAIETVKNDSIECSLTPELIEMELKNQLFAALSLAKFTKDRYEKVNLLRENLRYPRIALLQQPQMMTPMDGSFEINLVFYISSDGMIMPTYGTLANNQCENQRSKSPTSTMTMINESLADNTKTSITSDDNNVPTAAACSDVDILNGNNTDQSTPTWSANTLLPNALIEFINAIPPSSIGDQNKIQLLRERLRELGNCSTELFQRQQRLEQHQYNQDMIVDQTTAKENNDRLNSSKC